MTSRVFGTDRDGLVKVIHEPSGRRTISWRVARLMIDWWLARSRTTEMLCGAAAFVFGIGLMYLII